jgi:hypothetical protein
MGMQFDVKGVTCPASAATTIYNGRTRVKGLTISATTANATVAVADGATTLFTYTATGTGPVHIAIPGDGVLCQTSAVITCAAGISAVAFYG